MGKKLSGRKGTRPCKNCREFINRVERGGGKVVEANGSHVKGYAPDGSVMTAYRTNGRGYPKGIASALGKWLAGLGLVLVFVLGLALIICVSLL